jgi:hypothetical protein
MITFVPARHSFHGIRPDFRASVVIAAYKILLNAPSRISISGDVVDPKAAAGTDRPLSNG